MTAEKRSINNDELDLVDLLGVVIRHRRFICWFVAVTTLIGLCFVGFKEYKKLATVEKGYTLENALSTDKDAILVTYMFLKKGADKEGYDKFLSLVLFPSTTGVPDFGVVNKKGSSSVTYLFYNRSEALEFMDKYNSFIDLLTKVSNYSKKLGEEAFSNCRQFNSSKGNISGKDLFMYFRNTEDMKYCNFFNYYYSLVQGRINYALTDAPLDNYVPFIVDFLDSNVEKVKLVLAPVTEESKNKIKIAKESSFNKKKIIKYAAILFSISFVLSIFMVFIMEFWRNNRVRLSRYWRG